MSSLITTAVVVVVLVIVIGAAILTCALGWNSFLPRLVPGRWHKKNPNHAWPQEKYPYPSRTSVDANWAESPIQSPSSSPVASPRASRQSSGTSSDLTMKHGASTREVV